ncbi:hypothetical protein H7171_00695 [Candidatus Saccharibacteria bacterium]|nr:hypothetical protein [Candidatus Saccharibacteria bacterium]
MAEKQKKSGIGERGLKLYRNFNAVGAIALFGVGVVLPVIAPVTNVLAGINVLQSGAAQGLLSITKK